MSAQVNWLYTQKDAPVWQTAGKCPSKQACDYTHPPILLFPAGSFSELTSSVHWAPSENICLHNDLYLIGLSLLNPST